MEKIEINTPEPEKVIPILRDAIERQKRILSQSLAQTQERIQQLATQLQVNPNLLLAGKIPHPEDQDMDLLELEGELEILRHLREQLENLEKLTICP
jgi:fructose-1,6-bisphosphatase